MKKIILLILGIISQNIIFAQEQNNLQNYWALLPYELQENILFQNLTNLIDSKLTAQEFEQELCKIRSVNNNFKSIIENLSKKDLVELILCELIDNRNINDLKRKAAYLKNINHDLQEQLSLIEPTEITELTNRLNEDLEYPISKFAIAKIFLNEEQFADFANTEQTVTIEEFDSYIKAIKSFPSNEAHIEKARELIKIGVNLFNLNYVSQLDRITTENNLLYFFIKSGAHLDHRTQGSTLLTKAIDHFNPNLAILLVDCGTNVNLNKYLYSQTSLMAAMEPLNLFSEENKLAWKRLIYKLIAASSNLNHKTTWGQTALMIAIINSATEIAKYLIETGVELNILDYFCHDALYYAKRENLDQIVELINRKNFYNKLNESVRDTASKLLLNKL